MKYYLKENGSAGEQSLKEYTFEELKAYFEPNKDELPKYWEKWNDVQCILDLENYLRWEYDGMAVPYSFESVKNLKWCVINDMTTNRCLEEFEVYDSKEQALKDAKIKWEHLTERDKKDIAHFIVGLCNVEQCENKEWQCAVDEIGIADATIYEVAKEYK